MLSLVGVNLSIFGSIFCDSDDEAVESSKNNEKSPKGKDIVRVTENTKNDTYTLEIKRDTVNSAV